jgi:cobalt/nickel transport system permease protein
MVMQTSMLDIDRLDRLGDLDTPIHRLDPRAKLLTAMVFLIMVVSFPKHTVSALVPFFLFPVVLATVGRLPLRYLAGKMLIVAPFALLVAVGNPFLDREIVLRLGSLPITGGWLSFLSVLLRIALTAGVALVLIGVTSFRGLCSALRRCGVPKLLTVQLLLFYRYLFVLGDEATRMLRARRLRSFNGRGMGLVTYHSLLGHLLLRTLERAKRIHLAMLSRGFTGEIPWLRGWRLGLADLLFVLAWCAAFLLFRLVDVPRTLGQWIIGTVL